MDKGYIYDGSFEGLLTSIYEAFYSRENPCFIFSAKAYDKNTEGTMFGLLEEPERIVTDMVKYKKVYEAILEKISEEAAETIYYVYLSEIPGFEKMTLDYLRFGFKTGFDTNKHLENQTVLNMLKAERKVVFEVHRMLGFIRFETYSGIYYASYEPDHNITELITPHFVTRLSGQNFIIHDIKRELASFCNHTGWYMSSLGRDAIKCEDKSIYQELWKSYFKSATIEERKNIRNQKRQMPRRYWKHLPEI